MKKIISFLLAFLSVFLVVCSFYNVSFLQASKYANALWSVPEADMPEIEYIIEFDQSQSAELQQKKLIQILDSTNSFAGV